MKGLKERTIAASVILMTAFPLTVNSQVTKVFYDVSTVKSHPEGDTNLDWRSGKESFQANNVDLLKFIAGAWDVRPDQVVGGPAWVGEKHWDMMGKVTEADPAAIQRLTKNDLLWMQQKFLSDRFHLEVHLETRTGPVYDIVPARSGIKLRPLAPSADGASSQRGGITTRSAKDGGVALLGRGVGIDGLSRNVALNMHKSVINKTNIPNDVLFDFDLNFLPDSPSLSAAQSDAPPMREALEQQLGLHLEPSRGPMQVVVIDSVEQPNDN